MRHVLPTLAIALAALTASPALATNAAAVPTLSIDGKGEVVAAPDTATVTAGVTTDGQTARAALDANTKAMGSLLAVLKGAKIDPKDIQTSGFSVSPQYVYPDRNAAGETPPPRITGYSVSNNVTVKVRALGDLGAILDQMVTAGSNTINGVSFSVEDPAKLFDEARKAAFADAREKAGVYADAAGVALGPIVSIAESGSEPPQPRVFAMKAMADAAPAPVPVQPGQVTFDVDVSVVWSLKALAD